MSKIDISAVYEMFETIKGKLDKCSNIPTAKCSNNPTETTNADKEAAKEIIERLETVI